MGMGARTKRAKRLEKIFDVAELRGDEQAMNRSWMMQRDGDYEWMWVPVGVSVHYGSSLIEQSNFEVAERMLDEACEFWTRCRYDNWVGPQIRTLMVRVDDAGALRTALEIRACLSEYGILDESDVSEREHAATVEYWEESQRSDVQALLVSEHEIPEDLALCWEAWRGLELSEADFDALAFECEAWQDYSYDDALDMEGLAKELAGKIRVKLAGEHAEKLHYRECRCCGEVIIGPVWSLCHGCDADGDCDAEESQHCTGEAGHMCDGTVCEEQVEQIAEKARKLVAYGGMLPEDMTPLW